MPQAQSLRDLMRIRAHNRELLDDINGTLGTALGFKKPSDGDVTDIPCVVVFVPMKIKPKWLPADQLVPKELEGPDGLTCPLDVVEGQSAGEEDPVPRDDSELAERLRGWDERVWAGSQISHWVNESQGSYSMGTLGAYARSRSNEEPGLLTNKHVALEPGQKLYHPVPWGTHLATTAASIEYVRDEDWYGPLVDEPDTFVRIDCAFARVVDDFAEADVNTDLMGVGALGEVMEISLDDVAILGQKVLRVGRTTGLRTGTVVGFGYEYVDDNDVTVYTDLLIVGDEDDKPFSTHGDSGSLIVTNDDEHRPVGLLWGGWQSKLRTGHAQENWTYGIALSRVLDALDIDLVTG